MNFKYHPKLIEHLVRQTRKTLIVVAATSIIALWVYRNHIPLSLQVAWSVVQLIFIFLRYSNAALLQKYINVNDEKKIQLQTRILFLIIIFSAIIWNIIIALGFVYAPDIYALFSFILVSGLINGAILSLSSLVALYTLYVLLLLVPQAIYMFLLSGNIYSGVILMILIYIPYALTLSRLFNKNLLTEIKTNETLKKNINELHELSITDPLTKIYNRRYFFQASENLIKASTREHKKHSLLMIDLDNFKKINDTYGHKAGDIVLVSLASKVNMIIREGDIFARVGGEEFTVFLYATSYDNAKNIAQKICTIIEKHTFISDNAKIKVTVSIGVAELNSKVDTLERLYGEADSKLYEAKKLGRNLVC